MKRNPINLTDLVLTEPVKEVLRMGANFAPTPTRPVDLYNHYIDFHRWAEHLRWHFFHSNMDPDKEDDFVKPPWYKTKGKKAPKANREVEDYIRAVHDQVFDPDSRRQIKDNLTQEQREAINKLANLAPDEGKLVRFEDKGSRFVIDTIENHDQTILDNVTSI